MTTDSATAKPGWDQIMLAMDVVDTLRHREAELDRLVNEQTDDAALVARVRRIYEAQGIDVSERVIRDAVDALKEERFNYEAKTGGWKRKVALWYVNRSRWGKKVGLGVAAAAAIGGGSVAWNGVQSAKESGLQSRFQEVATLATQAATTADARSAVEAAIASANTTLALGGSDAVAAVDQLERMAEQLARNYQLRIVSENGTPSGVYRNPKGRSNVRNYYVIVDAVNAAGKPVKVLITSEEDNKAKRTSRWGLRVSESAFEAVKRDKLDDGIIQNNLVGEKRAGALKPVYKVDSDGGTILDW